MTYTYKLVADRTDPFTEKKEPACFLIRKEDGALIPKDEANTDYQEYLEWAKTNTADPAN
tara:strand:+ start:358 stop:537 length:180 start_codon:yes stop_codon:yes gene_type:complete